MDLHNLDQIERATRFGRAELARAGCTVLFIAGILIYAGIHHAGLPNSYLLISAAAVGGYMAMNIGANDVANNVGPAVGSRALTLSGAIAIAAIFESTGALVAGGDVVGTIKGDIIDPALIGSADEFIWLMLGALLAGGIWLNIATALGAPVSTTHAVVGGVLGAGIAAGGWDVTNWHTVGAIVASWVISPVLGGVIAAGFLYAIKRTITYQTDMVAAATRVVPILIGIMAWAFTTYLVLKGLKAIWKVGLPVATGIGLVSAVTVYLAVRAVIGRTSRALDNSKSAVNSLFTVPLIFAAALLSFAHGANDVANAIGPLAAINDAVLNSGIANQASIPSWVMVIGALGISLGLALYGPKLIRTVGSEITELDQMRAFCIAMAASITVIVATHLGLPVSSTHIAVGAVFGVGFLREYIKVTYAGIVAEIRGHHLGQDHAVVEDFLDRFERSAVADKGRMLKELKKRAEADGNGITKSERKSLRKQYRRDLVKRSAVLRIVAAWVVTVPIAALLGALIYFTIRGMMLP
ncbi:MAG: inorganic phosphate transporter [Gammaproteobacteria bacterium]|nr:inorganic phosphate transporter [Gammaproteobacteria bacterium]